ncbi:alpha/beta-hydrolase [Laetiporus sulphureus 93-53]|uniref:Alpha/beta-hydrolase n=1 Tax=Laetiporus sulphureus 93-53 TaxID=1314785 RepID=A0A165EDK1_9APHY|nr:alpha/beta-hydrolase [Laetiporus sulphureus 93-53]KZT06807.1 alpha/beta-hydrolase [Laetiporus sulphureus 93-53]
MLSSPMSNSPQLQRHPSRKPSFLSIRRDKKSTASFETALPPTSRFRTSEGMSPSSFHALGDAPNRPRSSRGNSHEQEHNRKSSKSASLSRGSSLAHSTRGKERQEQGKDRRHDPNKDTYVFPTIANEKSMVEESYAKPRRRSHTGPSRNEEWDYPAHTHSNRTLNVSLVDSASSVLSQYDAPPTPVEDLVFRSTAFSVPVVVAAPVAGVETMDALVDGMNHRYGIDDHFMGMGGISGRTKISKSGHHPLYHPPLPTPPPGIVLGKAGAQQTFPRSHDSDGDDDPADISMSRRSEQRRTRRSGSIRTTTSANTATTCASKSRPGTSHLVDPHDDVYAAFITPRSVAPSISEIIRAHAPPSQQARSRKSSICHSALHVAAHEQPETDADTVPTEDETDLVSRSSVDTIAEEVQRTIRNQKRSSVLAGQLQPQRSFHRNPTVLSDTHTLSSPRSDGRPESSLFSYSSTSDQPSLHQSEVSGLTKPPSDTQAIAQYLRSVRLTTLLHLTRSPHASGDHPFTVSLSDLGHPYGHPLVVFLGLGCVRHIMGLYDEMAECLGIRLITIDRWGLGRTDTPRSKSVMGIPEWAAVVEEVLDLLHIDRCSVMAHSAGAPYALAFANRYPERICGDICLLAPWVGGGEGAGYKWLKYVPNGILKTAQAAEWKLQAWMIGKPPTFAFQGIGFDATSPVASNGPESQSHKGSRSVSAPLRDAPVPLSPVGESKHRPSTSSTTFSDYDDLRDFEGRFDSRSTLERRSTSSEHRRALENSRLVNRKPSRGFLGRFKSGHSAAQSPTEEKPPASRTGKKLKVLRSMGSLRNRSRPSTATGVSSTSPQMPLLPAVRSPKVGLGLDNVDWTEAFRRKSTSTPPETILSSPRVRPSTAKSSMDDHSYFSRAHGRRSMSLGPADRTRSSSPFTTSSPTPTASTPANFQAALGNALLAASHAESSRGTHRDLLQILNHDRQPWGFSYSAYPHRVRVWYGDKDERIAENAVRWMESTMGSDKCQVKVVKDADHALMYRSGVVVDVLERVSEFWQNLLGLDD